jgi:hypothetical protein
MLSQEERLRILKMIQEGKLNAEEGMQLLENLGENPAAEPVQTAPAASKVTARWFHVRVTDTTTGKIKVNVRMPINVVSAGIKMGARFSPEVQGIDTNLLMSAIQSGQTGLIAEINDDDDKEHVEVFIE